MMADPDGCPVCVGEQRTTWMFTHLAPPATVQSCEEHAEINMITLLATRLNVDGAWLYDVIATAVNAAANEAEVADAVDHAQNAVDDRSLNAEMYDQEDAEADAEIDADLERAMAPLKAAREHLGLQTGPKRAAKPRSRKPGGVTDDVV